MDFSSANMNGNPIFNGWGPMFSQQQAGQPPTGVLPNGMPSGANTHPLTHNGYPGFMQPDYGQPQQMPNGMPAQASPIVGSRSPPGSFPQQSPAQQASGMAGFSQQFSQMPNGYNPVSFSGGTGVAGAGGSMAGYNTAGTPPNAGATPGMPNGYPQGMDPTQMMQQMWLWQMQAAQMQAATMQQQQAPPSPFPQPSGEDDKALAKALAEVEENGRTLRQVIEDFANSRKQSAASWKDHYLTHKPRLDRMADRISGRDQLAAQLEHPIPADSGAISIAPSLSGSSSTGQAKPITVKKPVFGDLSSTGKSSSVVKSSRLSHSLDPELSEAPPTAVKRRSNRPSKIARHDLDKRAEPAPRPRAALPSFRKEKPETTEPAPKRARVVSSSDEELVSVSKPEVVSTRTTRSSNTNAYGRKVVGTMSSSRAVPIADTTFKIPELQRDVTIPSLPARTPTPPTGVTNSRFSDAEKKWFLNFIRYHLDRDPELKKIDLSTMMHQQAPYRPVSSWTNHWNGNSAADIIYNMAEDNRVPPSAVSRPKAVSSLASSMTDGDSESHEEPPPSIERNRRVIYNSPSEDGSLSEDSQDEHLSDFENEEMGPPGSKMTLGDLHALARYVASHSARKWKYMASKSRWEPMHQKYPTRVANGWGNHYMRHRSEVLTLARRYRKRNERMESPSDAPPLPASRSTPRVTPKAPLSQDKSPSSDLAMDLSSDTEPTPARDLTLTLPEKTTSSNGGPTHSSMNAKASLKERARRWTVLNGDEAGDGQGSGSPLSPETPVHDFAPPIATLPPQTKSQTKSRAQPVVPQSYIRPTSVQTYGQNTHQSRVEVVEDPLVAMAKNALGKNSATPGTLRLPGRNPGARVPNGNGVKTRQADASDERDMSMSMSPVEKPPSHMNVLRQMLGR